MRRRRWYNPNLVSPVYFGRDALPCPFCGGATISVFVGPAPHVTCDGCEADGPLSDEKGEIGAVDAINLWNTRK